MQDQIDDHGSVALRLAAGQLSYSMAIERWFAATRCGLAKPAFRPLADVQRRSVCSSNGLQACYRSVPKTASGESRADRRESARSFLDGDSFSDSDKLQMASQIVHRRRSVQPTPPKP